MTCAVAYRPRRRPDRKNANSLHTVLAVDGRITDEHGTIYSDTAIKWCQADNLVCVWAGDVSALQAAISRLLDATTRRELPKDVRSVVRMLCAAPEASGEWSCLMYDSTLHELWSAESDGSLVRVDQRVAAIGSGSEVALGHLLALKPDGEPWPESKARRAVRDAIRSSAKRNASVGSKATVLTVGADGRVRVRG